MINEPVVIDNRPYPPRDVGDLRISPGAEAALDELRCEGFALIVITNQPDISRGRADRRAVERINDRLRDVLGLDAVYVCEHDDRDCCSCRKPLPGLIFSAASDFAIDVGASYLVGDRWRDIGAGRAAGCTTVLIDRGYDEPRAEPPADQTVLDIGCAARWIRAHAKAMT